jgi:hypothetical protein
MDVKRFMPIAKANLVLLDQGYSVEEVGRILMLSYGDVKTKHSGLVSSSLVNYHEPTNQYFRKGKFTEEHFITRTNTCRKLCYAYLDGTLTDMLMEEILDYGRQVHYTTEDENMALRRYQDNPDYPTWEEQYAAAGVELVEDPGTFGSAKYYYEIGDKVYKNINEAADGEGVHPRTIKSRSRNDKFETYNELEYVL